MSILARRLAVIVSWVGHPLIFVPVSVGVIIALRLANRTGLLVLATLLVMMVGPIAVLLFRGVRTGRWGDADVSVRTERTRFYPRAISITLFWVATLWLLHAPGSVLRGALVTLVLLVVAAIVNLRVKLSLHALFAFLCTVMLFRVHPIAGFIALMLALLVFWSRLHLERHDFLETICGTALGIAGGIATAWWP